MRCWTICQLILLLAVAQANAATETKSNGSLCVESVGVKSASKAFGNMLKGYVAPKTQDEKGNSLTEKLKKENPNYHVNQVGQAWLLNPNASAVKPTIRPVVYPGDKENVGPILVPGAGVTIRVLRPLTFPTKPTTTGTTTKPLLQTLYQTAKPIFTYAPITAVTERGPFREGEIETPFPELGRMTTPSIGE